MCLLVMAPANIRLIPLWSFILVQWAGGAGWGQTGYSIPGCNPSWNAWCAAFPGHGAGCPAVHFTIPVDAARETRSVLRHRYEPPVESGHVVTMSSMLRKSVMLYQVTPPGVIPAALGWKQGNIIAVREPLQPPERFKHYYLFISSLSQVLTGRLVKSVQKILDLYFHFIKITF